MTRGYHFIILEFTSVLFCFFTGEGDITHFCRTTIVIFSIFFIVLFIKHQKMPGIISHSQKCVQVAHFVSVRRRTRTSFLLEKVSGLSKIK